MPLSQGDLDRILDDLSAADRLSAGLAAADQAIRDAFWKDRNPGVIAWIGKVVLKMAGNDLSPDDHSQVKTIAYNVASFLWPGWGEEDIKLTPDQTELGQYAADLNLRLAYDLNKPTIAKSRAHWMVGGYRLTTGQLDQARENFETAAKLAREDGNEAEGLLSDAFRGLATADPALGESLAELRKQKDGDFFADQIVAAGRVCGLTVPGV